MAGAYALKNGSAEPPGARFHEAALVAMLASGYLAMLGSGALDWPSWLAAGLAIGWRVLRVAGLLRAEIPQGWVPLATLGYILFYPLDYYYLSRDFLTATVHLVVFVAAVKVLTAATPRDFFFVKVIAMLEMLAAALLSANPSYFFFLVTFLISTVAALMSGEIRSAAQRTGGARAPLPMSLGPRLSWLSGVMAFGILALSAGLFFVLPRTARAALERFLPGSSRVSGFSEEISLGEGGAILKSSTAVMHVRFTETNQPPLLRWRGATLAEFDGQRWYNSERQARALYPEKELLQLADDEQRRRPGLRFTAQIWMHGGTDLLFLAGRPEFLRVPVPVVYETAGGALRVARDTDGLQYILFNYVNLGDRLSMGGEALDPQSRNFYLRLPPVDPRVFDLARRITQGYQLDRDRAAAIEHFLRTKLSYSLDNNPPPGVDPLSWFLFDRRRGHCEYFASAMAVMLRLSWIPARVATGYLPGDFNPISGWHVIRASHAHAWVEAWLPGEGWVVFDPTPPSLQTAPTGLMSRLSLYLDAADMFWREWVIGYDLERQLTLAFRVDQSRRRLRLPSFEQFFAGWSGRFRQWQKGVEHGEALPIAVLLLVAAGALGFWAWLGRGAWLRRRFRRGQASRHDATVLYQQMLTLLRRRGLVKPAAYTPLEFARMAGEVPTAQAVEEFTHAYYEVRFRGSESAAARLPALLESIERLTR